jgi:hypothetical protein
LDTSESRLERPGQFYNVVLEKDGEDEMDRVRNEKVLYRVKRRRSILYAIKRRLIGLVTSCLGTVFQNTLLKERYKDGQKWREDKEKA